MRLIDTETLEFHEVSDGATPEYAILSHTWEKGEEVTFEDWKHRSTARGRKMKKKKGYWKIKMACRKAQGHGWKYLWADTNCIDKSSSAELSEAINSMFNWYQNASICYVYLHDVGSTDEWSWEFYQSKWFTRGWTLQELLAPKEMVFYSRDWSRIASRSSMEIAISVATKISREYLQGDGQYNHASIAQKMSWISRRRTTRIEDMAYCMLGIFGINMPLLYGEGQKSFTRLQEEIVRVSNDQTIFCWTWNDTVPHNWVSLLAPGPQVFERSNKFVKVNDVIKDIKLTYKMTNAGLSITLPIVQAWPYYLGILNAQDKGCHPAGEYDHLVCVPLQGSLTEGRQMQRLSFPPSPVPISISWALCRSHLYISSKPDLSQQSSAQLVHPASPFGGANNKYHFLLLFGNTEKLLDEETRLRDYNRSELSPGNRVCLLETRRPMLKVFPTGVFDDQRSLITLQCVLKLPRGFLIRLGTNDPQRIIFIGIGSRSRSSVACRSDLYQACNVVPESAVKEASSFEELLAREVDLMAVKGETCEESSRYGIRIIMREETVHETDTLCLTYIFCEEAYEILNTDEDSETASDLGFESSRRHERVRGSFG